MSAAWQQAAATIYVEPVGHDRHLADCELAKESGPDATLACAKCGRAMWLHGTRADTCAQFCWVTEHSLTDKQIGLLGMIEDLPDELRQACARALSNYGLAPYYVRQARQHCAAAINNAKRHARKP